VKEIRLPSHIFAQSTDGPVTFEYDTIVAHAAEARRNGNKVILAALYIEREIEHVIGFYLYPPPNVSEQQRFFADHILSSDSLTFSAKRRLVLALVNEKQLLTGESKSQFEQLLKKVMSWRNAFTHGDVVERASGTYLLYFEGTRRELQLTDAFWDEVVAAFNALGSLIESIKKGLGFPQPFTGELRPGVSP
jgi:hypothetical protein